MQDPWEWMTLWNPLAWLWEQIARWHPHSEAIRLLGIILGSAVWAIASRLIAEFACKNRGSMTLWWIFFFVFNIYAIIFYMLNEEYQRRLQQYRGFGNRVSSSDRRIRDIVHSAVKRIEPHEDVDPELLELVRTLQFDRALAKTVSLRNIADSMGDDAGVEHYEELIDWVKNERTLAEHRNAFRNEPF